LGFKEGARKAKGAQLNKWESSTSLGFFAKHDRQIKRKMPPLTSCLWGVSAGLRAAHNPQLSKLFQVVFRQDGQMGRQMNGVS
jgi:hypothetical protein